MPKTGLIRAACVALLLCAVVGVASAQVEYMLPTPRMALGGVEYLLRVGHIPGELMQPDTQEWIDVISFTHQMKNEEGRVVAGPLSVVKRVDKAAPLLEERLCGGHRINHVTLVVRQASGEKTELLVYYLKRVTIAGTRTWGDDGGNLRQEVSFAYEAIEWRHHPVDPDGTPGPITRGGWSVTENEPL